MADDLHEHCLEVAGFDGGPPYGRRSIASSADTPGRFTMLAEGRRHLIADTTDSMG